VVRKQWALRVAVLEPERQIVWLQAAVFLQLLRP
jgi:hypothetical protein